VISIALILTGEVYRYIGKPKTEMYSKLLDLSTDYNLTQVHDKPTRENSLLDLIFTTNPSLIKSTANTPGISDHDIVVTDSDTKPYYIKQKPRRCFTFSKANWDQLKADITDISRQVVQLYNNNNNVHQLWDTFKSKLSSAIHSNIPSKMRSSNNSAPWISRNIKRQLKRKARLYKKTKKSNNWAN